MACDISTISIELIHQFLQTLIKQSVNYNSMSHFRPISQNIIHNKLANQAQLSIQLFINIMALKILDSQVEIFN